MALTNEEEQRERGRERQKDRERHRKWQSERRGMCLGKERREARSKASCISAVCMYSNTADAGLTRRPPACPSLPALSCTAADVCKEEVTQEEGGREGGIGRSEEVQEEESREERERVEEDAEKGKMNNKNQR